MQIASFLRREEKLIKYKICVGIFSTNFETFLILWGIKQGIYHINVIYHHVKHQLPFYILIKL